MRAHCLLVLSRRIAGCLLTLSLLVSVAAAKTNRAIIGSLTYLGSDQFGSAFRVTLDPSLVTSQSLSFANMTMFVDGTSQGTGPVTTPVTILFIGGTVDGVVHPLASCASGCVSIAVQLLSATGEPFSFKLLDGQELTTFSVTTVTLKPLPGEKFRREAGRVGEVRPCVPRSRQPDDKHQNCRRQVVPMSAHAYAAGAGLLASRSSRASCQRVQEPAHPAKTISLDDPDRGANMAYRMAERNGAM
jgi:hypothetical protein